MEYEHKPKSNDPKGNEALGSKGKGKLVDDEDEEEEDLPEGAKLKRKKCDQVLDENLWVAKEAKAREKEARDDQECILNEAIDNPNVYWLEPIASFELQNTSESQLYFIITLKAFLFWCFDTLEKAPNSDNNVNLILISLYLKHGKPQYRLWSSKKITVVKVFGPIETESLINARFKALRRASKSIFKFTLADMSCLNP